MADPGQTNTPDSREITSRLLEMITSSWMTQALYVAASLGIADLLAQEPRSGPQLADQTNTHAPSLHRLLRALVTLEICTEHPDGRFELTPLGSLLRRDAPLSVHSWTLFWGGSHWANWGHLLESVRTGQTARTLLAGTEGFQHLEQDPQLAAVFNRAMVELTRLVSFGVVQTYDFSGMQRIVDVGGGYGELLGAILQIHPQAQGVLFDMPHAIKEARRHLVEVGVADRCECVAGSFFESVPGGADTYVLKSVLHDWDDAHSQQILGSCRRAMPEQAKLVLVEQILPERLGSSATDRAKVRSDLNMLVGPGGRERTEAEFRSLLG